MSSPLSEYTVTLEAATLRQRTAAAHFPRDKHAAWAVILLAAHWTMHGELSPDLLRECSASMSESDAVALAQTLGAIALRGAGMAAGARGATR